MLDGRIDIQGTTSDLRARGLLDVLVHDAQAEEEPAVVTADELVIAANNDSGTRMLGDSTLGKSKKPRKLVEDEARATGSVKWKVYKTYLKATYVSCNFRSLPALTGKWAFQFIYYVGSGTRYTWALSARWCGRESESILIRYAKSYCFYRQIWMQIWGEVRNSQNSWP